MKRFIRVYGSGSGSVRHPGKDSEGPKAHLSLQPPHQVKVEKAAFRFSQSATFYDKKFYGKFKQSLPKICTLGQ